MMRTLDGTQKNVSRLKKPGHNLRGILRGDRELRVALAMAERMVM
jgi:hypothetical protein